MTRALIFALVLNSSAGIAAADPLRLTATDGHRLQIARPFVSAATRYEATPAIAPIRSWPARHPVALGMLIGFGSGAMVGGLQYYEGQRPFLPLVAFGGGIGAGVGAGVGALFALTRR